MSSKFKRPLCIFLFISISIVSSNSSAQLSSTQERDSLLSVAREFMQSVRYCALITVDSTGRSHVRTMEPFPPEENMVVFLGTNRNSRKVREIRNNHNVTLYYANDSGVGYVTIIGTAVLVDDPKEKAIQWKKDWDKFYKNEKENYLLIKLIPEKLELLNYQYGVISDTETWEAPAINFKSK